MRQNRRNRKPLVLWSWSTSEAGALADSRDDADAYRAPGLWQTADGAKLAAERAVPLGDEPEEQRTPKWELRPDGCWVWTRTYDSLAGGEDTEVLLVYPTPVGA